MKYKLRKKMVAIVAGSMIAGSMPVNAMATESVELTGEALEQFLGSVPENEPMDMNFLDLQESNTVELMSDMAMIDEEEVPGEWVTVEGVVGGQIRFDSSTGTITETEVTITSANIPSSIGGVTVKEIGDAVFQARRLLESVSIPSSVERIGDYAFRSCTALESVSISSSVETIGAYAFYDCTALESVSIAEGVKTIGRYAFRDCTALKSVSIPTSVEDWDYAFQSCTALESVSIPEGVKTIGEYAFYDCTALESVSIPSSVETIGRYAFWVCSALESVSIAEGVKTIGSGAFQVCRALKSVSIPSSVEDWEYAFRGCTALESVSIAEGVETIGRNAFDGCTALKSVSIPSSVSAIETGVFEGCTALENVSIPLGVKTIGGSAFLGCTALKSVSIPSSVETIGMNAFDGCTALENVSIPLGVKTVGMSAFQGCTALESVSIPSSVETLGMSAFQGCTALESVSIAEGGVLLISTGLFQGCTALESVSIPSSIKTIGSNTFQDCTALESVSIAEGVLLISTGSFQGCTALENVNIPSSVSVIDSGAFRGCTALESVSIPEGVLRIWSGVFEGCTALESVNIPSSVSTIGEAGFSGCISLKMISIPSIIRLIYADVFADCDVLTDVYFEGTEEEWNTMTIRTGNDALLNARIHFNSTMPTNTPVITLGNSYVNGQTVEIELQDVGTFAEITATAVDYEGTALDPAAITITYASSDVNEDSADVEDFATAKAYLEAEADRTVTVTVTATDSAEDTTATATLTLKSVPNVAKVKPTLAISGTDLDGGAYAAGDYEVPMKSTFAFSEPEVTASDDVNVTLDVVAEYETKDGDSLGSFTAVKFYLSQAVDNSVTATYTATNNIGSDSATFTFTTIADVATVAPTITVANYSGDMDIEVTNLDALAEPIATAVDDLGAVNVTIAYTEDDTATALADFDAVKTHLETEGNYVTMTFTAENDVDTTEETIIITAIAEDTTPVTQAPDITITGTIGGDNYADAGEYTITLADLETLTAPSVTAADDVRVVAVTVEYADENSNTFADFAAAKAYLTETVGGSVTMTYTATNDEGTTTATIKITSEANPATIAPMVDVNNYTKNGTTTTELSDITNLVEPDVFAIDDTGAVSVLATYEDDQDGTAYTDFEAVKTYLEAEADRSVEITYTAENNIGEDSITLTFESIADTVLATTITDSMISAIANQTYSGSAITPVITVKNGGTTLVEDTDYNVAYSDNINVGTATVTVTGIGDYTGTATTTFKIVAKTTSSGSGGGSSSSSSNSTTAGSSSTSSSATDSDSSFVPTVTPTTTTTAPTTTAPTTVTNTPIVAPAVATTVVDTVVSVDEATGNTVKTTAYSNGAEVVQTVTASGSISAEISGVTSKTAMTIPLDKTPSMTEVVVIVHEDGTREIVKDTTIVSDGLRIVLDSNASIEIVDNAKSFNDVVADSWYADSVAFATARELFLGMGDGVFAPTNTMTRAMIWQVLYNYQGSEVATSGTEWYAAAQAWATDFGVSDGTNPNSEMTREQLVTLLYRMGGTGATTGKIDTFSDSQNVSDWASDAMNWAVAEGILAGSNGNLNPKSNASRAEVAAIMMRFISK